MKILIGLTYYYPHWTGLTQYAQRLAEGLASKNYQVTVLTTKHQRHLKSEELINEVKIIRKNPLFRFSRTIISIDFILSLYKEIKNNDIIIAYLPLAEVFLVGLLSKIFKKKLFLVHNGDLVLPRGIINRLTEKFYYLTTEYAIKVSEGIILHTKDYAVNSKSLSKFKDKFRVILPPFETLNEDEQITNKLKAKINRNTEHVIGFAGRFVEEKGFDILLASVPYVLKKIPDALFLYAGETNIIYENFFQKHLKLVNENKKHLLLLGRLKKEEMASFYKICDVFVVPSRTDCFPFVLVEALLSGVPVVVTNIPGARWSVNETKMGVVVKPKSPQALANGICEALLNKKKYMNNNQKVKLIFNRHKSLNKYEKLFRQGDRPDF